MPRTRRTAHARHAVGRGIGLTTFVLALLTACGLPAGALAHHPAVAGTLVELHGHKPDRTIVGATYAIRSGDALRRLADEQPAALIGQRVQLHDAAAAPGLQGSVRAQGEQRLAAAVAPGPRSLLVIVLTTPDEPAASATVAEARAAVFTAPDSVNAFFAQQSAGATSFVGRVQAGGDVAGPLAIGVPMTGCDNEAIAAAADAAASASGFAVGAYDHVLYFMPNSPACDFGGLGELPGRRTWSNGYLDTSVIAHELGHNLGAHHADSARCTTAGGSAVMLSPACVTTEYGDPFDVMGIVERLMSSWHRAQLGQLPAGQELRVRQSQSVGLVSSDDFATPGPRLLLVPRKQPRVPVSSWLAVELRSQAGPFDLWPGGSAVTTGVSVRLVPSLTVREPSRLLDAEPSTTSRIDAPLQPGETVSDAAHGIAITLGSVAGTTASVAVTMPPFVDDVPPSAVSSVSLSGNSSAVALRWTPASDDEALAHYEIERDGVVIGTTPGLAFDDAAVAALAAPTYRVIAVDTSANRTPSSPVAAALADVTPPSAVPGLRLALRDGRVRATWSAAQDNRAVTGYRVRRDGSVRSTVSGLSFSETARSGRSSYVVSALDAAGNEGPRTAAAGITGGSSSVRPRIVLVRRTRQGGVVTLRFSAKGATSLSAYRGSRRVARASGTRLTVRLTLPRGVKRPRVKVVARSRAGTATKSFAMR